MPIALLGLAVVMVYAMYTKNKAVGVKVPGSRPSNYQPSQPSQNYPFTPNVPPRTDNSTQPWYNGSQKFNPPTPVTGGSEALLYATAGQSVVHSLGDIWGMISPKTDVAPDQFTLQSTDSLPPIAESSPVPNDSATNIVSGEETLNITNEVENA